MKTLNDYVERNIKNLKACDEIEKKNNEALQKSAKYLNSSSFINQNP